MRQENESASSRSNYFSVLSELVDSDRPQMRILSAQHVGEQTSLNSLFNPLGIFFYKSAKWKRISD